MSVKVKDVGNYKIHVKETFTRRFYGWELILSFPFIIVGSIIMFSIKDIHDIYGSVAMMVGCITTVMSGPVLIVCIRNPLNWFMIPSYYIDTTMYGVGGKTIRKTTPERDHIAICRAAQEFEKEILERIAKEKELGEIVGKCK